ncbi:MAG: glycoside hydrolase family protein [Synechococcaceae cyanobacterium RL_1_2]|nr:glycoside hydrolase family protein [Synechococcaceae cyanobacterium RL_1_2]
MKLSLSNLLSKLTALVVLSGLSAGLAYLVYTRQESLQWQYQLREQFNGTQPLVMTSGDPYIRALMRTITASEANDVKPYNVIYGGKRIYNLDLHPNICVPIRWGPNRGLCSTAAGRYQFLNTTWEEKAKLYHPEPKTTGFINRREVYSFEPEYQDFVMYSWLSDRKAWGFDITKKLQQNQIEEVLCNLSQTWTSLGCGIEDNSVTPKLVSIYHSVLGEELAKMKIESPQISMELSLRDNL